MGSISPEPTTDSSQDHNLQLDDTRGQVVAQARQSVKWSLLNSLGPRLITPITSLVLAALLEPSDFGRVAISLAMFGLLYNVIGQSFGLALVQRKDQLDDASNAVFWTGIGIGAGFYALMFAAAPLIGDLYDDPRLPDVIRIMMLAIPIYTIGMVPYNLMWRNMAFKNIFWVTSLPRILAAILAVVWALMGGGLWSLLITPMLPEIFVAIVPWRYVKWRPSLKFNAQVMGSVLNFGSWVFAASLVNWGIAHGDNIVAGLFLNTDALGAYTVGYNYALILPNMVMVALGRVTMSAMSRLQDDVDSIGRDLLRLQARAAIFIMPLCFAVSAFVPPAFNILYGEKWVEMTHVLRILSLLPGIMMLWQVNLEALRAIGRPDVWPKVGVISMLIGYFMMVVAGPLGVVAFTFARALAAIPYIWLTMRATRQHLKVTIRQQVDVLIRPLIAAMTTYILANGIIALAGPYDGLIGLIKLVVIGLVSGTFYLGFLWVFYRNIFYTMIYTIRQVIGR